MMQEILDKFRNKKIVILGFGREGKSTYEFLRKHIEGIKLDIIDENIDISGDENKIYASDSRTNIIKTHDYIDILKQYDVIFKTPGISFKGKNISDIEDKITSQLEVFLDMKKAYTIGITGTKGKSTTSSLIYQIIHDQGKRVHLLGNIGKPIFTELDEINSSDIVVLEISSHQSQYIKKSPNIGIILNIFEEHLDHYNSYDEYIMAKINVLKYQSKSDYSIYNANDIELTNHLKNVKLLSNQVKVDINDRKSYQKFDFNKDRKLLGKHNDFNIMVALKVTEILGLDIDKACDTIYKFDSLPHRLEKVGTYDDVTYYNDSIATIPEATITCIETLKNVNTIIVGGLDRGIEYLGLAKYLNNCYVENIICMYETGKKIYGMINDMGTNKNVKYFENLQEACKYAKKITKKGTICALSPAAASYGHFKNFEERGNYFKDIVSHN